MTTQPIEIPDYLVEAFPAAGPELLALLAAASENAGLMQIDFLTIRDLVELSDYQSCESLHALLLVLFLALEEGSLSVEASESSFERRLSDLIDGYDAHRWVKRIM